MEPRPFASHFMAEPGELARRDEGQRLVGRLEDLPACIQLVTPCGLIACDARVQHQVVVSAGDGDRVELNRPELPEDLEHPVETRKRPRGCEEVSRDEKTARGFGRRLHREDASAYGDATRVSCEKTQSQRPSRRASTSVASSRVVKLCSMN